MSGRHAGDAGVSLTNAFSFARRDTWFLGEMAQMLPHSQAKPEEIELFAVVSQLQFSETSGYRNPKEVF
jgi:hypothetical protein